VIGFCMKKRKIGMSNSHSTDEHDLGHKTRIQGDQSRQTVTSCLRRYINKIYANATLRQPIPIHRSKWTCPSFHSTQKETKVHTVHRMRTQKLSSTHSSGICSATHAFCFSARPRAFPP
jgi:hypothetical protein